LDFEKKVGSKRNAVIRISARSASWWQQLKKVLKKQRVTMFCGLGFVERQNGAIS